MKKILDSKVFIQTTPIDWISVNHLKLLYCIGFSMLKPKTFIGDKKKSGSSDLTLDVTP